MIKIAFVVCFAAFAAAEAEADAGVLYGAYDMVLVWDMPDLAMVPVLVMLVLAMVPVLAMVLDLAMLVLVMELVSAMLVLPPPLLPDTVSPMLPSVRLRLSQRLKLMLVFCMEDMDMAVLDIPELAMLVLDMAMLPLLPMATLLLAMVVLA